MAKPAPGATLNTGHAMAANIIHSWLCNEGTGTNVADGVTSGSIAGTMTAGAAWGTNAAGDAVILLDTDGEQVNLASAISLSTAFTIAWRAYQNPAGSTMPFGDASGTTDFVWYQNGSELQVRANGTDGHNTSATSFTSQTDNYGLVLTGGVFKLYKNGSLVNGDMTAGSSFSLRTLGQGFSTASFSLKGGFDYLHVYSDAKDGTFLTTLSSNPYAMYGAVGPTSSSSSSSAGPTARRKGLMTGGNLLTTGIMSGGRM